MAAGLTGPWASTALDLLHGTEGEVAARLAGLRRGGQAPVGNPGSALPPHATGAPPPATAPLACKALLLPLAEAQLGRIVQWAGPPGSGKTQACHWAVLQLLRACPSLIVVWIDASNAFSAQRLAQLAALGEEEEKEKEEEEEPPRHQTPRMGAAGRGAGQGMQLLQKLPTAALLKRLYLFRCADGHELLDVLHQCQPLQFHVLLVDSISACLSPHLGTPSSFPVMRAVMGGLRHLTTTKHLYTVCTNTTVSAGAWAERRGDAPPFGGIPADRSSTKAAWKPALGKFWARFPDATLHFHRVPDAVPEAGHEGEHGPGGRTRKQVSLVPAWGGPVPPWQPAVHLSPGVRVDLPACLSPSW